jgi:hypothetical protein
MARINPNTLVFKTGMSTSATREDPALLSARPLLLESGIGSATRKLYGDASTVEPNFFLSD